MRWKQSTIPVSLVGPPAETRAGKGCGKCKGSLHRLFNQRFHTLLLPLLCWFYSLYFALVMPLICWGAVGQPGHPHRLPHFVFVEPVTAANAVTWVQAAHSHHQQQADTTGTATAQPSQPQPADVAGRSTPAISAIVLLTLILSGAWLLHPLPQFHFPIKLGALYVRPFAPLTRTPPPRPMQLSILTRR